MKTKKIKHIVLTMALALGAAAGHADAGILTFDGLTAMTYGDGAPLATGMGYDGLNLTYEESGFRVTLHAPDAQAGAAHISDGTFAPQTFNWHDGMENGAGTFVTVTRIGGGLFNLLGFDYYTDASKVSADGALVGTVADAGSWNTALTGISELRLSSGAYNELDNIRVENMTSAVPMPGSVPLMLAGLALGGMMLRRQR